MIQTELTPNPDSLKFLSEKTISSIGMEEFQKKEISKVNNEFVKNLLNVEGVELVLLAENFITVNFLIFEINNNSFWKKLTAIFDDRNTK